MKYFYPMVYYGVGLGWTTLLASFRIHFEDIQGAIFTIAFGVFVTFIGYFVLKDFGGN